MPLQPLTAWLAVAGLLAVASAAPAAAQQNGSISTTSRVSLTILPSATLGSNSSRSPGFIARGSDGRDLGRGDVQIVFRDGRGERVLNGPAEIDRAIMLAKRAGDDEVDVSFVF